MPISTKILLFAGFVLLAIFTGYVTGHLARADGATVPAAIRAGAIGFGGTLTLLLAVLTAYVLL